MSVHASSFSDRGPDLTIALSAQQKPSCCCVTASAWLDLPAVQQCTPAPGR
jgi:hypothetical protein